MKSLERIRALAYEGRFIEAFTHARGSLGLLYLVGHAPSVAAPSGGPLDGRGWWYNSDGTPSRFPLKTPDGSGLGGWSGCTTGAGAWFGWPGERESGSCSCMGSCNPDGSGLEASFPAWKTVRMRGLERCPAWEE